MAPERLSRLQRRILAWLLAEAQRTRGTMAADHRDLVRALAHDKGNLSTSLKGLEAKGLVTIARTAGGKAEAIDLTPAGRREVVNKEEAPIDANDLGRREKWVYSPEDTPRLFPTLNLPPRGALAPPRQPSR